MTKRLILAFATQPGTPEGQGSSVNLVDGLAEPSPADVGGPHAHRHSHPPGNGPQGPPNLVVVSDGGSAGSAAGCLGACGFLLLDEFAFDRDLDFLAHDE